jgi:REP-associated tyrosine transposase
MPRKLRPQHPGLTYHVFTRGIRFEPIYEEDVDRRGFLRMLAKVVRRSGWVCHAYCLMTNHYHLLVSTPYPNIARGMQWLNSRYAEHFNRRYGFRGHLFKGRYGSVVAENDAHFLVEFRYVVRNPVRAGLCRQPEDWPWSSYRFTLGLEEAPEFLATERVLSLFSSDPHEARRQLLAFVNDAAADEARVRRGLRRTRPIGTRIAAVGV